MADPSSADRARASGLVTQVQQVLIEAGRVLAESIEYRPTLKSVAHLVVPSLADWYMVEVVSPQGRLEPVVALHREPQKSHLVWELRRRYPAAIGERAGAPRVVETGESELYPEVTEDLLRENSHDDEHLELLRGLRLRSGIAVPLMARGSPIGALTLASEESRYYSESVLPLVEELGRQCGLAVDNARLFQEARASEQRYRSLFDSIDAAFVLGEVRLDGDQWPRDFLFVEVNPAFSQQTGLQDVVGRTLREVLPNLEAHWLDILGEVALEGEPQRFVRESKPLGRWFDCYAFRPGDPAEGKVALLFKDITQQKKAELERERLLREVQAERQHLAELFQYSPSVMCLLRGPDHVFERANELYQELVGHRELVGRTVREVFPELEGQGLFELLDRVYETGEPYVGTDIPIQLGRRDSDELEERWLNFVYQPVRDAEGSVTGIFAQGVDLTERKQAEEALRASERQQRNRAEELEALMDAVPAVVLMAHDPDGRRITGNPEAYRFFRVSRGANLSRGADPGEKPETFRVFQGGAEVPPSELPVQRAARGQEVSGDELEVRFSDGEVAYLFGSARPLRKEDGEARGSVATMLDITRGKMAEQSLRELNATLEQRVAERSAEAERRARQLQAMAAELSRTEERERRRLAAVLHDHLQQLLVGSKMQLDVLASRLREEALGENVEKVMGLLDESIETSRNLTVELSPPILYQSGLVPALEWLGRWMEEKHHLAVHLSVDGEVGTEDHDLRLLVFQSVRELLFNSAKYAGVDEARVRVRLSGEYLEVTVSDEGVGFDPEVVREEEAGGLGVSRIRERVDLLGGSLELRSRPGEGTTITLWVPWRRSQPETRRPSEG